MTGCNFPVSRIPGQCPTEPARYGTNGNQDRRGLKIQGPDLARIQEIGTQIQQILSGLPDTNSIFAERVSQGFYLNVEVNRPKRPGTGSPWQMFSG